MSKQTRTVLKGYFQTGDIPTESQYVDFIDSKLNLSENNTGNIQLTGNITASSNISSSATIIGNSGSFESVAGTLSTAAQPNVTSLGTLTSLTSTGNVSSSFTSTGSLGMLKLQSQLFVHKGEFDIGTGNKYTLNPSSGTGFFELKVGTNRGTIEYDNNSGNGHMEIKSGFSLTTLSDDTIQLGDTSGDTVSISGSSVFMTIYLHQTQE